MIQLERMVCVDVLNRCSRYEAIVKEGNTLVDRGVVSNKIHLSSPMCYAHRL